MVSQINEVLRTEIINLGRNTTSHINLKSTDTEIGKWKLSPKPFPRQKVKAQETIAVDKKSQLASIVANLNTMSETVEQKSSQITEQTRRWPWYRRVLTRLRNWSEKSYWNNQFRKNHRSSKPNTPGHCRLNVRQEALCERQRNSLNH